MHASPAEVWWTEERFGSSWQYLRGFRLEKAGKVIPVGIRFGCGITTGVYMIIHTRFKIYTDDS